MKPLPLSHCIDPETGKLYEAPTLPSAGGETSGTPIVDAELIRFEQFDNAFVNEHIARQLEQDSKILRSDLAAARSDLETQRAKHEKEKADAIGQLRRMDQVWSARDSAIKERDAARAELAAVKAVLTSARQRLSLCRPTVREEGSREDVMDCAIVEELNKIDKVL